MNIKKILALTIVVLALFGCMSAASAGLFDWFKSEPANETYNFTVCSFQLPENASITNYTKTYGGTYQEKIYTASFGSVEDNNKGTATIVIMNGSTLVTSINEFIKNWESDGGVSEGTYGDWCIINIDNVTLSDYTNSTFNGYILAKHNGNNIVSIRGENLTMLKKIVDTYQPI